MSNKSELKGTVLNSPDTLDFKYMGILALKAVGRTYPEIAEKTGFSESWIKRLFMRGGKLYEPYHRFKTVVQEESLETAWAVLYGELPDVVRTMATTAKLPFTREGVAAGKAIMDLTLGDPSRPIGVQNNLQINNNIQVTPERQQQIVNAFRNFGLLETETQNATEPTNQPDGDGNNSEPQPEETSS